MTHSKTILTAVLLLLTACTNRPSSPVDATTSMTADTTVTMTCHSHLLRMQAVSEGTLVRVRDPWHPDADLAQYLLVDRSADVLSPSFSARVEACYGTVTIQQVPLQRIAVTSGCHTWLLAQLGALDQVAVLCDTGYICSPEVQSWMRSPRADGSARIADGGSSTSPNAEILLSSAVDALWTSPMEGAAASHVGQLPIPVVYCADYMETSPLGRAEWMRFYGRLVGKAAQADSLFEAVSQRYLAHVGHNDHGPRLLAELPYGATWYVPGGQSTASQLYQDAGFVYPWADDTHAGSLALSQEAVLAQAADCDVWIIKYHDPQADWTLSQLTAQNPAYSQLRATQAGQVWGCNTARSDFFDVTPFRPDSLLESLSTMNGAFFQRLPSQ